MTDSQAIDWLETQARKNPRDVVMIFRLYHVLRGDHVHCRLFAGVGEKRGKCGDLCMQREEFEEFRAAASFIQFSEDWSER